MGRVILCFGLNVLALTVLLAFHLSASASEKGCAMVLSILSDQFQSLSLPEKLRPVTTEDPLTAEHFSVLLSHARDLALSAHGEQKYGDEPYQIHLEGVVENLLQAGFDPEVSEDARALIIAAWLHDTTEDTLVTYDLLELIFGKSIALLVDAVKSVPEEAGLTDEQWELQSILKVRNHRLGPALKVADRLLNVRRGVQRGNLKSKYVRTYPIFRSELRFGGPTREVSVQEQNLWDQLDGLLMVKK